MLKALQSITSRPITLLISAGDDPADGTVQMIAVSEMTEGTPEIAGGLGSVEFPVRRLRASEFTVKRLRSSLPKEEVDYWVGMTTLKRGFELNDQHLIETGYAALAPALFPGCRNARLLLRGGQAEHYLGGVVSHALSEARLVFWQHGEPGPHRPPIFETGIFCPDFATAMAVRLVLHAAVRLCPQCGKVFNVTRKNSTCCCPEHANRYRVAKCRLKKETAKKRRIA
jgi:hypothetical protein